MVREILLLPFDFIPQNLNLLLVLLVQASNPLLVVFNLLFELLLMGLLQTLNGATQIVAALIVDFDNALELSVFVDELLKFVLQVLDL